MAGKRKVIVFGAGAHARGLLVPSLLAAGRCEMVAWVDPSAEARHLAREKFPRAPLVAELDLGRAPDGALAVIATPPAAHPAVFEAVHARGWDCFIEKPLAATHAEAQAMCARLQSSGPQATVGLWMRHSPLIRSLKERMPAPCSSELTVNTPQASGEDRILDTFVYLLDMALATHPSPPAAIRVVRKNPPDCEITFHDASRSRLVWRDAHPAAKEEKWHFSWEDPSRQAHLRGLTLLQVIARDGCKEHEERAGYHAGFRFQLDQLLRDRFLVPLADAARTNRLFDAMMTAREGSSLPL